MELFTQQDTDLMLEAAREAPYRGNPCWEPRIRNETRNRSGEAFATACRIDGQWRLLGGSQLD